SQSARNGGVRDRIRTTRPWLVATRGAEHRAWLIVPRSLRRWSALCPCSPFRKRQRRRFLRRRIDMGNRGIVFVASIALLALAGCATHQGTDSVARSTESDVPPSTLPADLVGTWSGASVPVGAGPGGQKAVGK